jgi:ElaB/YqjD/DUF883 family membrane-anchored ribosome-binding protein
MDTTVNPSTTQAGGSNGAAGTPQKVVERATQTAHAAIDRLAAAAGPAIDRLTSGATSARGTLQSKADQLGALEEQWISSARGYVREHPFTAVAIGLLAGWVVGKLGSGRD